jgi:peptidase MA superfamily protein
VKNVPTIAGVGALALLALLIIIRGEASANDGPSCAPSVGFVPQLCVNVPVGTSVRHETTVPLSTVFVARAEVRVEAGVPAGQIAHLATSVDGAISRVERAFDRTFPTRPRILVFATRASFARATQDLFGYSAETAATVAMTYGGVFDRGTRTIAVSWQAASGANLASLLAHELTHLATREIVGPDATLPAWFEEGLAALIESGGIDADAQLAARSLLANAPRTLDTIGTLADWHRAYAAIGVALYAVSADAVEVLDARLGRTGTLALLADVGRGTRFEVAYRARSGENLARFMADFADDLALEPSIAASSVPSERGDLVWTLFAFAPHSDVRVTITGPGYDLTYTVRTDGIGMYRGTFGSTAARGTYTLSAAGATTGATATIDTTSR